MWVCAVHCDLGSFQLISNVVSVFLGVLLTGVGRCAPPCAGAVTYRPALVGRPRAGSVLCFLRDVVIQASGLLCLC